MVKIVSRRNHDCATVALSGTFDFTARALFRNAYEQWLAAPDVRELVVDLREVSVSDSTVPGMLLVLRERARRSGKAVRVRTADPVVDAVLDSVRFSA